jgi:3,4-dihydroxy 2-butanone 4-phosphate synthase/GTP cyclohydrolase II
VGRTLAETVRVPLPTPAGVFEARAFEAPSGHVYLALLHGDVEDGSGVLARLHSECLTGDALGSLRCDCGVQLRQALRRITAEGRGVLVYATGQEGRGIGLVNKLRAYVEQDEGHDTLDANVRLGLPVDGRRYDDAAGVLAALGLRSVRLLTNNPAKVAALREAGIDVVDVEPLPTAPHVRNVAYLRTKERRLGHTSPTGDAVGDGGGLPPGPAPAVDPSALLGDVRERADRPYVVLKFAQTIDGRIATSTGDARWISGEAERRVSHALRAACDAVLVGIGTVLQDDPLLTVRLVAGASPQRVVLDSSLRIPPSAKVLGGDAATAVVTTPGSSPARRSELQRSGVQLHVVPAAPGGVDLPAALLSLREVGTRALLVEGGAQVITSMLAAGVVDRLVVGVAPTIIGRGTEAVGPLGITSVADGIRLVDRSVHVLEDDVLLAWDVVPAG